MSLRGIHGGWVTCDYWVWVQNQRLASIYTRFYDFKDNLETGRLCSDVSSSDEWDEETTPPWDDACVGDDAVEELVEDRPAGAPCSALAAGAERGSPGRGCAAGAS